VSDGDEPDDDLRVSRRGDALVLLLHEREVQVLGWVFADLSRLLGDEADAVTQRLFPRAYLDPTEEAAESQWQSVVHGDLVETRLGALRAVAEGLDGAPPVAGRAGMYEVVLDEAAAELWLGVVNDARIALGTALGVTAETDTESLDPDDARFDGLLVYDWLTHLLASLLHGAAGDLDEWGGDDGPDGGGPEGGTGL
jgi:Domain of unknown function (DUF2017)